jgi:hypothetical protein
MRGFILGKHQRGVSGGKGRYRTAHSPLTYLSQLVGRFVHRSVQKSDTQGDSGYLCKHTGWLHTIRSMIRRIQDQRDLFWPGAWLNLKAPTLEQPDGVFK